MPQLLIEIDDEQAEKVWRAIHRRQSFEVMDATVGMVGDGTTTVPIRGIRFKFASNNRSSPFVIAGPTGPELAR